MTEKKCWIHEDHVFPRKLLKGKTIINNAKDPKASCEFAFLPNGRRGRHWATSKAGRCMLCN